MPQPAITNTNIVVERIPEVVETRTARRKRLKAAAIMDDQRQAVHEQLRRQIERIRQEILHIACSSAWAEDCLYRGIDYAPDFRCHCALCESKYPQRLYPRQARESRVSADCQVEFEEDPELAEDFARLRNERLRVGSVFIAMKNPEHGSGVRRRRRKRKRRGFALRNRTGGNTTS